MPALTFQTTSYLGLQGIMKFLLRLMFQEAQTLYLFPSSSLESRAASTQYSPSQMRQNGQHIKHTSGPHIKHTS
jgi:hypothetical protein